MSAATSRSPDVSAAPQALATFFRRFDAFCAAAGREPGPVSRELFGDSGRVSTIRATPSDVGVKRLAAADAKLSEMAAAAGISLPDGLLAGEPPRPSGELSTGEARDV